MPANGYDHSQSCLLFTAALLQFIRIPAAQAFGVECITLLTIPLELVTASLAVASFAVSYAVQPVVRDYARRDRYYLIQRFIRLHFPVLLAGAAGIAAVVSFCILLFGRNNQAGYFLPVFAMAILLFLSPSGLVQGAYAGIRSPGPVFVNWALTALLTAILPMAVGRKLYRYGKMAGAILRSDELPQIYAAMGLMIGLTLAFLISFVVWIVLYFLFLRHIDEQISASGRGETESNMSIFFSFSERFTYLAVTALMLTLPLAVDYGILKRRSESANFIAEWGYLYSRVFPLVIGGVFLLLIPFAGYYGSFRNIAHTRGAATLRSFSTMVCRLAVYCAAPLSFFFLSAALVVTSLPKGVENRAATAGMQHGALIMLFLMLCLILILLGSATAHVMDVMFSSMIAFVLQSVICYIVTRTSDAVTAVPLSLLVLFASLFLLLMFALRRFIRPLPRWGRRFLVTAASAAAAAMIVSVMSERMYLMAGAYGALVILAAVYGVIYLFATCYFGGVDLENIARLPGGRFLMRLAEIVERF